MRQFKMNILVPEMIGIDFSIGDRHYELVQVCTGRELTLTRLMSIVSLPAIIPDASWARVGALIITWG
eukprot:scaffold2135_cov271-Chaetoceros_neogracile.AAC.4